MTSRSPTRVPPPGPSLHASSRSGSHTNASDAVALPGPRSLDDTNRSTNSIASLLKDSSSLSAKMEAMEQQMLATHMRACSATEEAEAAAKAVLEPVLARVSALEAEVRGQGNSRQNSNDGPAAQMLQRLEQAEQALSTSQKMQPTSSTEQAVLVARLEASVMVMTRSLDENERKLKDMQQDHTSQWVTLRERIESAEVARGDGVSQFEGSLREEQCRRGAEVAAVRTRMESLEQTLVSVDMKVNASTSQVNALEQDSRISSLENSSQELPALQARLDVAERQLQQLDPSSSKQTQEQALKCLADIPDVVTRLNNAEKMLTELGSVIGIGSPRGRAASPAPPDVKQSKVSNLETTASIMDLGERLDATERRLAVRLEQLEAQPASVTTESKAIAPASAGTHEVESLKATLTETKQTVDRLTEDLQKSTVHVHRLSDDLADERKERYSALADVNHLTEVVAKAAAATIERAERRFAEELGAERDRKQTGTKETSGNDSQQEASTAEASQDRDATNSKESVAERVDLAIGATGPRAGLGSDLARCVGEMDAELRMELTSTINSVYKELDSLRGSTSARFASVEARIIAVERNPKVEVKKDSPFGAELKDVANELGLHAKHYSSMLETSAADRDGQRASPFPKLGNRNWEAKIKPSIESYETGSTTSSQNRRQFTDETMSAATEETQSMQANTLLSDMFKQAMKVGPGGFDARSPQHQIPEDLKSHLKSLVSAVNRTLGEDLDGLGDDLTRLDNSNRRVPPFLKEASPNVYQRSLRVDRAGSQPPVQSNQLRGRPACSPAPSADARSPGARPSASPMPPGHLQALLSEISGGGSGSLTASAGKGPSPTNSAGPFRESTPPRDMRVMGARTSSTSMNAGKRSGGSSIITNAQVPVMRSNSSLGGTGATSPAPPVGIQVSKPQGSPVNKPSDPEDPTNMTWPTFNPKQLQQQAMQMQPGWVDPRQVSGKASPSPAVHAMAPRTAQSPQTLVRGALQAPSRQVSQQQRQSGGWRG